MLHVTVHPTSQLTHFHYMSAGKAAMLKDLETILGDTRPLKP